MTATPQTERREGRRRMARALPLLAALGVAALLGVGAAALWSALRPPARPVASRAFAPQTRVDVMALPRADRAAALRAALDAGGGSEAAAASPGTGGTAASDASAPRPAAPAVANRYALLIAVERYQMAGASLSYPAEDLYDMRRVLRTGGGVPADHIKILQDASATKANIKNAITVWMASLPRGSEVIFYFSGHGYGAGAGDLGLDVPPYGDEADGADEAIVPYDFDGHVADMIWDDELHTWFDAAQRKAAPSRVAMIFDSCFAGGMVSARAAAASGVRVRRPAISTLSTEAARAATARVVADGFAADVGGSQRLVIGACQEWDTAMELPGIDNGLFTFVFAHMLGTRDGDLTSDGRVCLQEAFMATENLMDYAAVGQLPVWNNALRTDWNVTELDHTPGWVHETRLFDASRYGTAAVVSAHATAAAGTVVLCTGRDYPDALCAAPLAAALDAPILLTPRDGLDRLTASEIVRLRATRLVVVGGPGAVSDAVISAARRYKGSRIAQYERVAGSDRFGTSAAVAERLAAIEGTPTRVVVAGATGFADALAAAPLAAANGWPILLTERDALPPAVAARAAESSACLIVGGTGSVGAAAAGLPPGDRVYGADRFATCAALATYAQRNGLGDRSVTLATGADFPDALAAGSLVARERGVLLLTERGRLGDDAAAWLAAHRGHAADVHVIGGEDALTPLTVDHALDYVSDM